METQPPSLPPDPIPNPTPEPLPDPNIRQWALAIHLSPLIGLVVPFGNLLAPLIIWLIKRPESPVLDSEGKSALNFQISITLYALVSILLMLILVGFLTALATSILWIYGMVMAGIKTGNGEPVVYPLSLRFLK